MRLDAGASETEREHICSWVEEAPEHFISFARAMAAWDKSGELKSAYGLATNGKELHREHMRKFILGLD